MRSSRELDRRIALGAAAIRQRGVTDLETAFAGRISVVVNHGQTSSIVYSYM
jgi:hypothetical protein